MRKILLPCAIATNLLLSPNIFAAEQKRFDFNYHQPSQPQQRERLVQHVNDDVYGEKVFKIKKMFNLGSMQHKHKKLVKLIVFADAYGPRAKTRMIINKRPSGQVVHMDQFESKFVFKIPEHQSSLDGELRSLQLEMRGRIYVQKIVAVLKEESRIQTITEDMWETYQGQNTIAVKRVLKLRQHQGKKLAFIEIEGDSARGGGKAQLHIDGYPVGPSQTLAKFGSTLRFKVPAHVAALGEGIGSVQIKLKGNIYIESISAGLKDSRRGGHQQPRSHSEVVDMDLSGNQTVLLSDLVSQLTPRQLRRPLKSVSITVSSKRNRGKAKLCVSGVCSQVEDLSTMSTVITEQSFGQALEDFTLQTRGKVTVEKIKFIFQ
ncbi:hypothetical protein A9Q84_17715 [Halobacteriovorax marinus]|uniref:Uncharacterized protein n=1 Tax=Halobacteriovorax marinus TaxID=97084 RepID=A0A1Y5F8N2_9BACT|nr:hypothetical protein A9Q84_17715 [Halobacteriovorax marinus]